MLVESIRLRLLLVAPLRLVLGLIFLGAARAAGGHSAGTFLAFAAGAFAMAFLVPNDPRARFRRVSEGPGVLPTDARIAPAWLHAVHAAVPSTVGVSGLAALALAFQPALSGFLAGILVGLGFAAGLALYRMDNGLYLDPRTRTVFRR